MNRELILPFCYLPPISWFAAYIKNGSNGVLLEIHENFPKQTYRNRAHIYSPNGLLALSIPIEHKGKRQIIKDVKICNANPWQKLHWKSLEASYRSSSFFEFFEDDFFPLFRKEYIYLLDFNIEILSCLHKCLRIESRCTFTKEYKKDYPFARDLRNVINPKEHSYIQTPVYNQVFQSRAGFLADLSIVDLLFNEGPSSIKIIRGSKIRL